MATLTREFPRQLAALGELLDQLRKAFERHAVDDQCAFWVTLAVEEVFTNMVRHNQSSGDRISVDMDITDTSVSVMLTDYEVPAFDPATVPAVDTTLPAEERSPGGLGVFIVQSKLDDVTYRHERGNMSVSFKRLRDLPHG